MRYSKRLLLLFSLVFSAIGFTQAQNQRPVCGVPNNTLDDPQIEAAYNRFIERTAHLARQKEGIDATNKTSENPNASKFIIPCVVHVCFQNKADSLDYDQIFSQFVQLFNDYRKVPGTRGFGGGVDSEIEFNLATKDLKGQPFNGIVYHKVDPSYVNFNKNDDVKLKTQIAPSWDTRKYFNIWLTKSIKTEGAFDKLAGYAQFPDPSTWVWESPNKSEKTDGVVCISENFGTTGTSGAYSSTMTHEIGHWIWLFHTFQGGCQQTNCNTSGDRICDTPPVLTPQFKDPNVRINSCKETPYDSPDNARNYMDYTSPDDACNVITQGQKEIYFRALQNKDWPWRYNLWQESNLQATGTGKYSRPVANFWAEPRVSCINNPIRFTDYSMGSPTKWEWEFPGGTPSTSTDAQPVVVYDKPGTYAVRLKVKNESTMIDSLVKTDFITVFDNKVTVSLTQGFTEEFSLESTRDFPPPGWRIDNPDDGLLSGITWNMHKRFNSFAQTGETGVAQMPFFDYNQYNQYDGLILPTFDFTQLTTPTLRFDYAYAPLSYTKTDVAPQEPPYRDRLVYALPTLYTDTLQIKTSIDCGKTWQTIWKKGGKELQTAARLPASSSSGAGGDFSSPIKTDWDSVGINLPSLKNQASVMVKFEGISGFGNYLYLDNVRLNNIVYTGIEKLSVADKFILYPNPTNESTTLNFQLDRPTKIGYHLFDLQGKIIYNQNPVTYSDGVQNINVDMHNLSEGIYILQVIVNDKISTQKVIKY